MATTLKQSLDSPPALTAFTAAAGALAAYEAWEGRWWSALASAAVAAFTGWRLYTVRQVNTALSDSLGLDN
jgi:hypothetical protein